MDPDSQQRLHNYLKADLAMMRKLNPVFLCSLEPIEMRGDVEFKKLESNPDAVAHYDPASRVIRIGSYSRQNLFHEIGHHVHNLGVYSSVVNDFTALSWLRDREGATYRPKGNGEDFFWRDYSKKNIREDWADVFALATASPLEMGLLASLDPPLLEDTPFRRKLNRVSQIAPVHFATEPVRISLGNPERLPNSDNQILDGEGLYLFEGKGGRGQNTI